jgi:AbiU2
MEINLAVKRSGVFAVENGTRISFAKRKTSFLIDQVVNLSQIHENNAAVLYTNMISKQIPSSRAGWAYEALQRTMFQYEIVTLYRIWDSSDLQKSSIPTIIELIDKPEIIDQLAIGWPDESEFGKTRGELTKEKLQFAIKSTKEVISSSLFQGIANERDKHLAHSLESTRREKTGPIRPMKYGDETELLNKTFAIAEALHNGINQTSYSFADSQKIHKRQSKALWEGVEIKVLE